jgi:hypothetical protein
LRSGKKELEHSQSKGVSLEPISTNIEELVAQTMTLPLESRAMLAELLVESLVRSAQSPNDLVVQQMS